MEDHEQLSPSSSHDAVVEEVPVGESSAQPQSESHCQAPTPSQETVETDIGVANPETARGPTQSFADFLSNHIPTNLVSLSDRQLLCHRFNVRLQQAVSQSIQTSDVEIGEDCLPTWSGWNWDPEAESIHAVIQDHLDAAYFSRNAGGLVRNEIVTKCRRKLSEAVNLGVELKDIYFGLDLLPQWPDHADRNAQDELQTLDERLCPQSSFDSGYQSDTPGGSFANIENEMQATDREASSASTVMQDVVDDADDELGFDRDDVAEDDDGDEDEEGPAQMDLDELTQAPHTPQGQQATDAQQALQVEGTPASGPVEKASGEEPADPESESSSENSCDKQDDQSLDNILYDVEVVGGQAHAPEVDLEVYLAGDSDTDIDYLPELELAVDGEAYEHHHGSEEAMGIELPEDFYSTVDVADSDFDRVEDDEYLTPAQRVQLAMGIRYGWSHSGQDIETQLLAAEEHLAAFKAREYENDVPLDIPGPEDDMSEEARNKGHQANQPADDDSGSDISEEGVSSDEAEKDAPTEMPARQQPSEPQGPADHAEEADPMAKAEGVLEVDFGEEEDGEGEDEFEDIF